jgi:hypothetical protein
MFVYKIKLEISNKIQTIIILDIRFRNEKWEDKIIFFLLKYFNYFSLSSYFLF